MYDKQTLKPTIDMSPRARYVVATNIYENPIVGRLTSATIHRYALRGFYGTARQHRALQLEQHKHALRTQRAQKHRTAQRVNTILDKITDRY